MWQLTPHRRLFVATAPVDVRKGSDGLTAVCRQVLGDNPLAGVVYVCRIGIVLMALALWRDELRAAQAHVMPELPHLRVPA